MALDAGHLASSLVSVLTDAGHTVSVAESCTGGLLGAALTAVPGSSKVFWGGVISYDDAAKRGLLGVEAATLERHGAVSREVAFEMAAGMRLRAGTTWAVAVTGVAGPGGGTSQKPVGLVFVAVVGPTRTVEEYGFSGDRDAVRAETVDAAMSLLSSCVSEHADGVKPARANH